MTISLSELFQLGTFVVALVTLIHIIGECQYVGAIFPGQPQGWPIVFCAQ